MRNTNGRPLVSAIVPIYNGEAFLAETLESVLQQTYRPVEIVAVNDGSTDESAEVVAGYRGVRRLDRANAGVASARNAGLEAARGDFVAFLDQDDLWLPTKIETQMALLLNEPSIDCAMSLHERFLQPGVATPGWVRPGTLDTAIKGFDPNVLLARRCAFEKVGPFDPRFTLASDSDWFFRATDAGLRFAFVGEVLVRRRIHAQNNSRFAQACRGDLRRVALDSIRRKRERQGELTPTSPAWSSAARSLDIT